MSLDSVLAAECADVPGVLCDFHLLHLLSERCTVSEQTILVYWGTDEEDSVLVWKGSLVDGGDCRIPCAIFTGHTNLCNISVSTMASGVRIVPATYSWFASSFLRCMRSSVEIENGNV